MIAGGSYVDATDFDLPAPVVGYGNGVNNVTATSFTDLSTAPCTAQITNPHPTAAMLCLVTFGAWVANDTGILRACPRVSGSVTIAAGIGGGGPAGWGEVIARGTGGGYGQVSASWTVSLPASTTPATFTVQAYRDAAGTTQQVNYPTLRIIPLRFEV